MFAVVAGASGCEDEGAPGRGFHSRQLVSSRDETLTLVGFGSKILTAETESGPLSYYGADPDRALYAIGDSSARTYFELNLTDNTVRELGDKIPLPDAPDGGPPERFDCRYEGTGTTGGSTLYVTDPQTGQDVAVIDRVVGFGSCARYPDGYLAVVRLDENDVGRLWTGPFDRLVRAELDLAIDMPLSSNWSVASDMTKRWMTVLAAAGPAPAGRGIYEIDLAEMTATALIPPTLTEVTWAPGATPSDSVGSDGVAGTGVRIVSAPGGGRSYLYRRQMNDGSEVMFAGPMSLPTSRELALFPIAGETAEVFLVNSSFAILGTVITWQTAGASGSGIDLLVNWDTANERIISCPFAPGTLPLTFAPGSTSLKGVSSPDRSRYAFADGVALRSSSTSTPQSGPLIQLSTGGSGSCALLAAKDVRSVALANEAVAWIESPADGGNQILWVGGAPGEAPRALGNMQVIEAPWFIAPHTLQVQLGTDLAWLDVRDDPVKLHYVAEKVFGKPVTGSRWLVTGYGHSSQDGTGTLGVVDWQTGEKHLISPAVEDFIVSSQNSADRPLNIVYRVRGRSASAQEGIWAATLEASDLP